MFKRITLILATLVAGAVGAVLVSSPAQAASCNYPYMCTFDASNWQGKNYVYDPQGMSAGCRNFGVAPDGFNWDNKIDSVFYNDDWDDTGVTFYTGTSCTGTLVTYVSNDGTVGNQLRACPQPAAKWQGACGSSSVSSYYIVHY
jgi:opacity protein-like surface antigen